MNFSLIVNEETKYQKVKNFDILRKEINDLKSDEEFIVLINSTSMNKAVFIQTKYLVIEKCYLLEIRFEWDEEFSQYSLETNREQCLKIFEDYFNSQLPDIRRWDNITKYLKTYYYNTKDGLHKDNVHPLFLENFKDDFYYNTTKYHSPFGNDSGFDAMISGERFLKEDEENEYYLVNIIDDNLIKGASKEEIHLVVSNYQTIIGLGFVNLKVNGFIMADMKEKTLEALAMIKEVEHHESYQTMINNLNKIEALAYDNE